GLMGIVNSTPNPLTTSYVPDQWYQISLAFHWTNHTVDFFVDDVLIGAGYSFRGPTVDHLSVVYLYNFNNTQSWWDELQFLQGTVPIAFPTAPTNATNFVNGVWTG